MILSKQAKTTPEQARAADVSGSNVKLASFNPSFDKLSLIIHNRLHLLDINHKHNWDTWFKPAMVCL